MYITVLYILNIQLLLRGGSTQAILLFPVDSGIRDQGLGARV